MRALPVSAGRLRVASFLMLWLGASAAGATDPSQLEQARAYFNVGVRAYDAGQYADAVQALQQAYKLTPRDGLLFSLAQAHRKQYFVGKKPDDLRAAIKYYRDYVGRVTRGGRVSEAADALAELEPLTAKLESEPSAPAPVPEAKPVTQIMISSQARGVRVFLDGHPAGKLPFVSDIEPGQHHLRLSAPGYQDYTRDIRVLPGSIVPLDVPLADEPARLSVRAPSGARISVDGGEIGTAPLAAIRLAPGRHFIAVTANGRDPFARTLELGRGRSVAVEARLTTSTQRTVSWVLIGAGASGLVVSGVLALGAYRKQNDAQSILDRRTTENISAGDREAYTSLRDQRDSFRTASLLSAGTGLAFATAGGLLFAFDEPRVAPPSGPAEPGAGKPESPQPGLSQDISFTPTWDRGRAGMALGGRF